MNLTSDLELVALVVEERAVDVDEQHDQNFCSPPTHLAKRFRVANRVLGFGCQNESASPLDL